MERLPSIVSTSFASWLRNYGFLRPREPEPASDEQMRRIARMVEVAMLSAISLDVIIYFTMRDVAMLSRQAVTVFAAVNLTGLCVGVALIRVTQLSKVRRPDARAWPWVCSIIALTTVVWIQLTGVVSSYFITMGGIQIMLYRWAFGWGAGMSTLVTMVVGHLGAFALEQLGVLPRTSLLREPANGLDAIPAFRGSAMTSIFGTYVIAYVGASIVIHRLRTQRRELERVRREMIGMAEGVRQGRLSGTELGHWFVDELLGRGGTGEVYAAHNELGEQVAVKVLYPHLAEDERAFSRFEREQKVGSQISGGFFPKLIEVARADDGSPYIVMERLRGEDLGSLLRRRLVLTRHETVRLARGLSRALDALHTQGIVHRDLTPGNVFLVASSDAAWPDLRILDLGMCKLQDAGVALTQTSTVMGTPGYMAPEQILGQAASAGPECDVFAFGAILYRALTGEQAFAATTIVEAVESVVRGEPVWPSQHRAELGPGVDRVFQKALAKRPEQRFSSASAFADALIAELDALPAVPAAAARALNPG
jgi:predicted Ser/Thr protein kinase